MWDVLGIEPTNDERAIKRAYARLLKKNRPDKDPVAFQELRDAYEWCLRATKWADYDDYDDGDGGTEGAVDDGFASVSDPTAVTEEAIDSSTTVIDGGAHGSSDDELDPFLPPDGPAERIMLAEMEAFASEANEPAGVTKEEGPEGRDDPPEDDGWSQVPDNVDAVATSSADSGGQEADVAGPKPFETLVAEFESLLGNSVEAQRSEVWTAWFEAAEEFSLHERQVLRSVVIDLTAIAWHDQPERTEQVLKELPYPAVIGLSDLIGWPHSQVELSENIPDDLVLLLGDVLEFDMITGDDRTAFFGASDPAMVDASMRPDTRRHRNAHIFGPFWCLYRRQFARTAMVIGGPVIISVVAALLRLTGVQVIVPLALIALFPFFKAGDVRIRWFFLCIAAGIAAIWVLGPLAIVPASYAMLAGPLHIEAGIKARQWREEQLQGAFAAIPPDMRNDADRRHSFLNKMGAPSRLAPWLAGALAIVIFAFLALMSLGAILSKNT